MIHSAAAERQGVSCEKEGFNAVLIDQESEYIEITRARVAHAQQQQHDEHAVNAQLKLSL